MQYNPRVLKIQTLQQASEELTKIQCDPYGVALMTPKSLFKTIKLEGVPAKAANLLKQTFLAKGGEVAVARGTADLSIERTDLLIHATFKQYRSALSQLKMQPWGLPAVAESIDKVLYYTENFPVRHYTWDERTLDIRPNKTLIMGILNITPDSFSDGGRYNNLDAAAERAQELIEAGADILDIGAESTRPYGASPVSAEEEAERLLPVLEKLVQQISTPISIDTYKPQVAEAALKIGAHMINDVWGLQKNPEMAKIAAKHKVPVIIMHNQLETRYDKDLLSTIAASLQKSIDIGLVAGIPFENFIIDPGIGFAKTSQHNLQVLARLEELKILGCPILIGTSRKKFIGEILDLPVEERVEGTAATVGWAINQGASIVRVHDVKTIARVAKMTDAIMEKVTTATCE
ncbi:dihydropteroate synthase [Acetonema longum]|uniref:Dihydropteroate synthase n=1 Tax=Acetonema longum DSM 6540 TaxID=1009370 RepID=F7NL26_9FIRM|nr:dihydropteroate synthase [Acetonema longum]EGO63131.1 dihydropteroate synthase [Acetonema longum DSM 6540]